MTSSISSMEVALACVSDREHMLLRIWGFHGSGESDP